MNAMCSVNFDHKFFLMVSWPTQVALHNSVLEADAAAEAAQRLSHETIGITAAAKLNDTHQTVSSPKRPTKA